jgi:hypothetical protein
MQAASPFAYLETRRFNLKATDSSDPTGLPEDPSLKK